MQHAFITRHQTARLENARLDKYLRYRRETALHGALVLAKSEEWDSDTIFCGYYRSIFNHCDIIGLQSYRIRWKKTK